jgi:hypothetical protein
MTSCRVRECVVTRMKHCHTLSPGTLDVARSSTMAERILIWHVDSENKVIFPFKSVEERYDSNFVFDLKQKVSKNHHHHRHHHHYHHHHRASPRSVRPLAASCVSASQLKT